MIRTDYTFNAAAKTITFANPVIEENIGVIANKDRGVLIYNSFDSAAIGTLTGQVLTLSYDTTGHSNSDTLQIFYSESSKHVTVDNSGTDIKISLDNETITTVEKTAQSAMTSDSPTFMVITGDPSGDFAGVDLLEQVMTDQSGLGLNVKIISGMGRVDQTGALMWSDAPVPITLAGVTGGVFLIDTSGYESLNITSGTSFAGNVTAGDDLSLPFQVLTGCPRVLGALTSAIAASSGYSFPAIARWIKITLTAGGTATAFLRQQAWNGSYTTSVPTANANNNITQFGSTNIVNAGVAGIPSVGGNIAPGTAATVNPVPVGGVDSTNLTRRFLTDTSGRQIVNIQGALVNQNAFAVNSNPVLDVGTTDGINQYELLSQIVLELRIMNQQMFNFMGYQGADTPDAYRADQSFISI